MERRDFLKLGGLIIGFRLAEQPGAATAEFKPKVWLRIDQAGEATILLEGIEIGQGIWSGVAALVAEELEIDWSRIHLAQAPADPAVDQKMTTGGSGGIIDAWDRTRRAGVQAREMLVTAAAAKWGVPKESCRAANGAVLHPDSGRSTPYGELVEAAARLTPPDPKSLTLKDPSQFRVIGTTLPRKDVPAKVDGSARFGIDVRLPGMLYAVVARCSTFGGKPASFDAAAAKAVPGVRQVIEIEPVGRVANTAGGVAVIADNTWAAIQGRNALKITWDRGPHAAESSETLRKIAEEQMRAPAAHVSQDRGGAQEAISSAAKIVEAVYELPFQPHATMEPMNCTVSAAGDRVEIWTGTQGALIIQNYIAAQAKLPPSAVTVHNHWAGGGFGRRYQWDYPVEAWQIAKAAGKPVKLVWTRDDDMQHDFYRPLSYHRMRAALDSAGKPAAWWHRIVSTSIRQVFDSPESLKDPARVAAQELDGSDIPYGIPKVRVDYAPLQSCVPRAWWRSVASSFNAFAVECFIDELAAAAGADPFQFRLDLLREHEGSDPALLRRWRKVLETAAENGDWGKPLPAGWGRGIAGHYSFDTFVAYVAVVSKEPDGNIRIRKVTGAVDCGTAVAPDS
ncbi:MAG TPA: molybdopterin cofactor-binding domain-containing protein, partial [Bryobacteraceae bacterium]|nr:molybdopterin cofactor-binding domain-containing protein [Bryobacteraceae bacterium]